MKKVVQAQLPELGDRGVLLAGGLLLCLVVAVAYAPIFTAEFVWDDSLYLDCPDVTDSGRFHCIWLAPSTQDYYHPLTLSSFWVEWRLWGDAPLGYHLSNLVFHAACVFLLWALLRRLAVPGAWIAALVFAIHPMNVDSVAWVAERKNLLAFMFSCAAALAYLKFMDIRSGPWYLLALGGFLLALLSKMSAAFFPVALLAYLWWKRETKPRDLVPLVPFVILAAALCVFNKWCYDFPRTESAIIRPEGVLSRIAASGWAIWFYIGKCVLPLEVSPIYPRWNVDPAKILHWVPLAILAITSAVLWRNQNTWGRTPLAALACIILALSPVLGCVDISFMAYSLVANHWSHFAIAGMVSLVVGFITQAVITRPPLIRRVAAATAATAVLLLGASTSWQTTMYRNPETWCRGVIERNPEAWVAHNNLGRCLAAKGNLEGAHECYVEAYRLCPRSVTVNYNLGASYKGQGHVTSAAQHLSEAISINPDEPLIHEELGEIRILQGDFRDAVTHLEYAVEHLPCYSRVMGKLGLAHFLQGDLSNAKHCLAQAAEADPEEPKYRFYLAWIMESEGQVSDATKQYRAILKATPDYQNAQKRLAALEFADRR